MQADVERLAEKIVAPAVRIQGVLLLMRIEHP
jgi:hypothetical protein